MPAVILAPGISSHTWPQGPGLQQIWGWIHLLSHSQNPRMRKIGKKVAIPHPYTHRPPSKQPLLLHPRLQSEALPGQSASTLGNKAEQDQSYLTRITSDIRRLLITISSARSAALKPPSPVASAAGVSPEVVTDGQGVLSHSEQPHGAGKGNFPLSPRLGQDVAQEKGKCLNWPEAAHFHPQPAAVWAAGSSSVWGFYGLC